MSTADTLTTIAENVPKVYAAGKSAEWNRFWDNFQSEGKRNNYYCAFNYWSKANFYPKYDFNIYGSYIKMFYRFGYYDAEQMDLAERLDECGVKFLFDKVADSASYAFCEANISRIPEFMPNTGQGVDYLFDNCKATTIDKLILADTGEQTFKNAFRNMSNLQNITIEGVIGRDIDFSCSPLTVESMKSVISCLKDYSETDSKDVYSVLFTDDCWTELEASEAAPDAGTWKAYVNNLGWLTQEVA